MLPLSSKRSLTFLVALNAQSSGSPAGGTYLSTTTPAVIRADVFDASSLPAGLPSSTTSKCPSGGRISASTVTSFVISTRTTVSRSRKTVSSSDT